MFTLNNLGKHENVLTANFGNGTIVFHKAKDTVDAPENMLLFNDCEKRKIGEISSEDAGKNTDELEKPKLVMRFSNPQSISALIHSLLEIQKSIFEHQNMS